MAEDGLDELRLLQECLAGADEDDGLDVGVDLLAWAIEQIEELQISGALCRAGRELDKRDHDRETEYLGRVCRDRLKAMDELSTQGVLLTAASASYKIAEHDREKAVTSKAVMREALEGMLEEFDTIFAPEYPRPNEEAAIAKARATIAADKEADKEADGE